MKYCFPYNRKQEKSGTPDEVIFKYADVIEKDEFLTYLKEHAETTIIIDLSEEDESKINKQLLIALYTSYNNIKFKLSRTHKELAKHLQEKEIPFFFALYLADWDVLQRTLSEYHPSDVYITNTLGFAMDKVRAEADKYECQVRVVPNVLQTNNPLDPPERAFFIRPEDVEYYEDYVDVLEPLVGGKLYSAIYDAYVVNNKWFGNLAEIIVKMPKDTSLDGRYLIDEFGRRRIKCDKKCIKGSSCHLCTQFREVADSLKEKNMMVNPQRQKPPMADYTKEQIGFSI